ncbi:hypothetical protein COO60DRAFT_1222582 [Scenedesmus sp. NREL 46B-D3]|nr:hypothetical protein COO60DRAFT_1222582 [Scenedesmus sp. NREL 46B-D3]
MPPARPTRRRARRCLAQAAWTPRVRGSGSRWCPCRSAPGRCATWPTACCAARAAAATARRPTRRCACCSRPLSCRRSTTGGSTQLSTLLDYLAGVLAVPGHTEQAAAAIQAACVIVAAVGERYRQQQDLLSLVLLYEAAQAELDVPGVLPRDDVLMRRLERQAADGFSVLETAQANLVTSKRKLQPGSASTALRQLARDCTEQLGVYTSSKRRMTRLEQWNKNLPLTPLR